MIDLDEFCQVVRQELADLAGNNYPAMQREQTGMFDALVSQSNTSGVEQYALDMKDGKYKQVLVEFMQPAMYTEMQTAQQDICAAGTAVDPIQTLVNIDQFRSSPVLEFDTATLRGYCDGKNEYITKRIAANLSGFFRSINRNLIALYLAGYGDFIGPVVGPKDVDLLNQDAGGRLSADPIGEIIMNRDFLDLGLTGGMITVGSGNLFTYTKMQNIGCCNDYGQEISELAQFQYYFDRDLPTLTGLGNEENFAAWHPGALQLARWNENKGEFAITTELYKETTFVDPVTGLEVDWIVRYDECNRIWRHMFYLNYALVFMPDEIYQAADERFGVNNTFLYNATVS